MSLHNEIVYNLFYRCKICLKIHSYNKTWSLGWVYEFKKSMVLFWHAYFFIFLSILTIKIKEKIKKKSAFFAQACIVFVVYIHFILYSIHVSGIKRAQSPPYCCHKYQNKAQQKYEVWYLSYNANIYLDSALFQLKIVQR